MSGLRQSYNWIAVKPARKKGNMYQVIVTTSPTLIAPANENRLDIAIFNAGTATVYIGFSDSAGLNGFPLLGGLGVSFDGYTGPVYGIVSSGSQLIGVIEI